MLDRLVTRPLARLVLGIYLHGLLWSSGWANLYEEPRTLHIKIKALPQALTDSTSFPSLKVSVIQKSASSLPAVKKHIFDANFSPLTLFPSDSSFKSWVDKKGKSLGVQWTHQALGTFHIQWDGTVLLKGRGAEVGIAEPAAFYKIQTPGLMKLQDVYLEHLSLKAQSAFIKGQNAIKELRLKLDAAPEGKESSLFQGCILGQDSSLKSHSIHLKHGSFVNAGTFHVRDEGAVTLNQMDFLNLHHVHLGQKTSLSGVSLFHNHHRISGGGLDLKAEKFLNMGQLQLGSFKAQLREDGLNEGEIKADESLSLHSEGLLENTGTLKAPSITLQAKDALETTGILEGQTLSLSSQDALVVDGTLQGESVSLNTQAFQGKGKLRGEKSVSLVLGQGSFQGEILSQNTLSLQISEAFLNEGAIAAEQALVLGLNEKGALTNQGHMVSATLSLVGPGRVLNYGSLYGKKSFSIEESQIENHKLVKSDGQIILTKGSLSNHDTLISLSLLLQEGVQLINKVNAHPTTQPSDPSLPLGPKGFVIEKDVTCQKAASLINEGHALIGGSLQGELATFVNSGIMDARTYALSLDDWTHPGLILGKGYLKTKRGHSTGVIEGEIELEVSDTFTNQGHAKLIGLKGRGIFTNLSQLSLLEGDKQKPNLDIDTFHNGSWNESQAKGKSLLTFKALNSHTLKKFINHEGQEVKGDSLFISSRGSFLNEGHVDTKIFASFGKAVNSGALKSSFLNAGTEFVNTLEAELKINTGLFSHKLLNEGEIEAQDLTAHHLLNQGSLKARVLTTEATGEAISNGGTIDLDKLTMRGGSLLNQGKGKIFIAQEASLRRGVLSQEQKFTHLSVMNEGLIQTPMLYSEAATFLNQAKGKIEGATHFDFTHLDNAGEVILPQGNILIRQGFRNRGKILGNRLKKESPDVDNEGEILSQVFSLNGKLTNKGKLFVLEKADFALTDPVLRNEGTGKMCLTQLTMPLEVPLVLKNAGTLEIVNSCNLPPQTTLLNEQGGHLSVTKSHMKLHRLENAGLFSCSDGTYEVKETLLGPTSVFSFKGTGKTSYLYRHFENEGVIESANGLNFKVASYLTKIGILSILGPLHVTLLGRQNVVDFYRKATLKGSDQVTFRASRFHHQGPDPLRLSKDLTLEVDSFHNEGVIRGGALTVKSKTFSNEGRAALAEIKTEDNLTITTEKFSSKKGSLSTAGNLTLKVTQGDAHLGDKIYDASKQFNTSNGAKVSAGKDMRIELTKGSFYNSHGTIAANEWIRFYICHTLRSTSGILYSKAGVCIKANLLEISREPCRARVYQSGTVARTVGGRGFMGLSSKTFHDPVYDTAYYDTSLPSLLLISNEHGPGDLLLGVNTFNLVGSEVTVAGWVKDGNNNIVELVINPTTGRQAWKAQRSSYNNQVTQAGSKSFIKARQGIDLNAADIRITGTVNGLNIHLRTPQMHVETAAHAQRPEAPRHRLISLEEAYEVFRAHGLMEDHGEKVLRQHQPRFTHTLSSQPSFSSGSRPVLYGEKAALQSVPSSIPFTLTMDRGAVEFITAYLVSQYMDLSGFQGNLYERLHQNALSLNKALITEADLLATVEAMIIYRLRNICDQAVGVVDKRLEVLEPLLSIPQEVDASPENESGRIQASNDVKIESNNFTAIGGHVKARDLHIHARQEFEAQSQKKRHFYTDGNTQGYRDELVKQTILEGHQKAFVMGDEKYHVKGIRATAGPEGGTYGSRYGEAVTETDHLHHHQTTTEHHDGGWFGTSSTTIHQHHTTTAVGNTYTSEGPFLYEAGSDKQATLEGTTIIGQDKGHIKGQELLMKPGVSTQESSTTSSKEGLFQSKSSHESARRASFLPSFLVFPDNILHFNHQKVQLTGTHLYAKHVKDDSQHFQMGMAKETCTSQKTQSHSHVAGYAETTTERGQEIGCPSTVQVETWETSAQKGTGATLLFEGVSGHIGHLATSKDFQAKAVPLKKWEKTTRHSAGFQAPILEGKLEDPLVSSYQGVRVADHPADQAASTLKAAHESLRLAFLVARMAAGDPSVLIDLLMRYVNLSWSFSQSNSFFETQHEVGCNLSFTTLTLDNEATLLQGFIKANNLHLTTDSFTVLPLKEEIRQHHASEGGSVSFPGFGGSYHRSSSTHTETIHTPSRVTADHIYLNCGNAKLSGSQIRARVIDAIIHNTLTLESVLNVLRSHTKGLDLSSKGDMRFENRTRVREKLDELAALVGVEQFYLTVGGLLHLRSALYGQKGGEAIPPRQLSTPAGHSYYVRPLPRQDNACGFYGLLAGRVYKNPRAEAVAALLKASTNPEIRALVAPEIMEGLIEGSHSFLPQADVMRALWEGDETAQGQVRQWAASQEVYEAFIQGHVARPSAMLSYLGEDGTGVPRTSTMDALAQLYGFGLEIYQLDEAGKLRLVHQFAGPPSALDPVRLVHVGLEEGGPLNHFERLEVNPEHITAAQILEETIPERDEKSGYVFNVPLGTAREFASTLQEFTEWINARQEIYEEALHQGLDEEEATEQVQGLEKVLVQDSEAREAVKVLYQGAESLKKPLKKMAKEEKNKSAPSSQKDKTSRERVSIDWKDIDLFSLWGAGKELKSGSFQPDLSQRGEIYHKLAQAYAYLEKVARDNPHLAKGLGVVLEWGSAVLEGWVYTEAFLTGTAACRSVLKGLAPVCGVAAATKVYVAEQAAQAAVSEGIEALGKDAASQGRTPVEAAHFQQGATRSAEALLTGLFLNRVRKQLTKRGPAAKTAVSKAEKGLLGEARSHAALKYKDYQHFECRLPRNQGLDGVFVKYGHKGEVVDIVVVESKYATKGGKPKLAWSGAGDTEAQQLSNKWMAQQLEKMKNVHPDTFTILEKHQDKIRFKANVLDSKGTNRWYDYGRYKFGDTTDKAIRTTLQKGGPHG